jgi:Raf kinase inhibitor-like YbhB/YbcL family protein
MQTRRGFLAVTAGIAVAGCGEGSGGAGTTTDTAAGRTATDESGSPNGNGSLAFSTPAFGDGGTIPERHTGVGADVSPELSVESVPEAAETLALVVDDPDANDYVHWLLWNVPADAGTIPEGIEQTETVPELDDARQGTNNFGELGYRGPLPPQGDGPHTYRFTMSAVDTTPDLAAGAGRGELASALDGHVVDTDRITGEFERE